ncbi:hypothetical protein H6G33_09750 [Calothrix sp. FACHB-1219]|uniref:hypothetical protein n=1 Tax=unclassified Calothrix TaxID=2619626 RepID=UPI00168522ED|nr:MULTISPECIES: hypothetical protein [unclassified Calothrix]MBD2201630.1 hypothetical protein [Calothrix sp. FACHB-168]MBD2217316.1 hypothetical protein [Calothrix sp. FACHB-1219]
MAKFRDISVGESIQIVDVEELVYFEMKEVYVSQVDDDDDDDYITFEVKMIMTALLRNGETIKIHKLENICEVMSALHKDSVSEKLKTIFVQKVKEFYTLTQAEGSNDILRISPFEREVLNLAVEGETIVNSCEVTE